MTENSGLKRQIRARMRPTGEPYSAARRAIQNPEVAMSHEEFERLFADIDKYRSQGWGRITVPHGYTVKSISDGSAIVQMPVIWEPRKDMIRTMASGTPTTHNVDELRALPKQVKKTILGKFQLMLDTAADLHDPHRDKRPAYVRENPEWHMLTSRN